MSSHLLINWSDFFSVSNLKYDNPKKGGVYIWGFKIDGRFVPYYVGIAHNLILRINEHLNFIVGGRYTIYHKNCLKNFKEFKNEAADSECRRGKIYIPNWPTGYKSFLENRKKLQPHIDYMVNKFTFSYAVIAQETDSWKNINKIEKLCISQIGKENLANTRSGICEDIILSHVGNETISKLFNRINP